MNKNEVLEIITKIMLDEQQEYAKLINKIDNRLPGTQSSKDVIAILKFISKEKTELLETIYEKIKAL